jgi:hypothetical protein
VTAGGRIGGAEHNETLRRPAKEAAKTAPDRDSVGNLFPIVPWGLGKF